MFAAILGLVKGMADPTVSGGSVFLWMVGILVPALSTTRAYAYFGIGLHNAGLLSLLLSYLWIFARDTPLRLDGIFPAVLSVSLFFVLVVFVCQQLNIPLRIAGYRRPHSGRAMEIVSRIVTGLSFAFVFGGSMTTALAFLPVQNSEYNLSRNMSPFACALFGSWVFSLIVVIVIWWPGVWRKRLSSKAMILGTLVTIVSLSALCEFLFSKSVWLAIFTLGTFMNIYMAYWRVWSEFADSHGEPLEIARAGNTRHE